LALASWSVYIVLCSDGSLYTGISTNVVRRFSQHRCGKGAKFFRGREAVSVIFVEGGHNRSSASRREFAIKKMPKASKLEIIAAHRKSALVSELDTGQGIA
jgi:putative endonuclease